MNRNPLISLLKMGAIFLVVCAHSGFYHRIFVAHVPLFMAVSVFLTYRKMQDWDWVATEKRIIRILTPFVLWGCIYTLAFRWHDLDWRLFATQLAFGHCAAPHLYFLLLLCANTLIVSTLVHSCKPVFLRIVVFSGMFVLCMFWQFSEANWLCFSGLPPDMRYTLGRFSELLPFALVGVLCCAMTCVSIRIRCLVAGVLFVLFFILWQFKICPVLNFGYCELSVIPLVTALVIVADILGGGGFVARFPRLSSQINAFGTLVPGVYYVHLLFCKLGLRNGFCKAV